MILDATGTKILPPVAGDEGTIAAPASDWILTTLAATHDVDGKVVAVLVPPTADRRPALPVPSDA